MNFVNNKFFLYIGNADLCERHTTSGKRNIIVCYWNLYPVHCFRMQDIFQIC